jgi:hypothetical protein
MTTPIISTGPKAEVRETAYRVVTAVVTLLVGIGFFNTNEAALWSALALSTVTLVFAIFFSTSSWRTALYAIVGPLGAVVGAYGLLHGVDWAMVAAAVAQAFGLSTAAAKTIQVAA